MPALALRTLVRYLAPIAVLTAIVGAPLLWITFHIPVPTEAAQARSLLRFSWAIAGSAWIAQLTLVGGVAPLVRAVAAGAPLSQLRALGHGIAGLVRMLLPCLLAVAAIAIGSVALVLPGLALLALLSLTGASTERSLPAPLLDSLAVVRANLKLVVAVVVGMVVLDLAIVGITQLILTAPLAKKPTPQQLGAYLELARITTLGIVAVTPLVACTLAAIRVRAKP